MRVIDNGKVLTLTGTNTSTRWFDLYTDARPSLYRAAVLMVGHSDAEEIVQDTFAAAMSQDRFFETVETPAAWLRTVLVRRAISHLRRRSLVARLLPHLAQRTDTASESRLDLETALQRLSPKQRAVVVLRYYHGLDYRDISANLGIPDSSLGPLLTRAKAILREALGDG